jgi:hypothetical protein
MGKQGNSLNPIEDKIFLLAKPFLRTVRKDEIHVKNALEFAFKLLESEPGERDIVIPAIILHDVGWSSVPEGLMPKAFGPAADISLAKMHERAGAQIAAGILEQVSYDRLKAAKIVRIIDGHDTRDVALSDSDKIVKDADKLTRYSKCFLHFAGVLKLSRREYSSILITRGEHWFFLPVSWEIAKTELAKWQLD